LRMEDHSLLPVSRHRAGQHRPREPRMTTRGLHAP
jgi:hypothetical protein